MASRGRAFEEFLSKRQFGLSEGSIYERLRRDPSVRFDPEIYHASLIYNPAWASVLEGVHREYLEVGQKLGLTMFALTDTWRASQDRVNRSSVASHAVNEDNAHFLRKIVDSYAASGFPIFVGGQIGPKGDGYKPEEAPDRKTAKEFHRPQIAGLVKGGVDFLYAATLPSSEEAVGIATAMAETGLPYVLSFVVRPDGTVLDGAALAGVIEMIDDTKPHRPSGYAINCVYPTVLTRCLSALRTRAPLLVNRIVSFQSNTSARDPSELDGEDELLTEDPHVLGSLMMAAHREFGIPFMGGCCGTDTSHIAELGALSQELAMQDHTSPS